MAKTPPSSENLETPKSNEAASESNEDIKGEKSAEERLDELNISLKKVARVFRIYGKTIEDRLKFWIVSTFVILVVIVIYYVTLFHFDFPDDWSWQFGYKTVVRITALTALFSLFAFCIKMVKSYLYMYEHNLHKRSIVSSMSSFVGSTIGKDNRDVIYSKMIDIVVEMGNTGLLSNESDFKSKNSTEEIIERLSKKEKD